MPGADEIQSSRKAEQLGKMGMGEQKKPCASAAIVRFFKHVPTKHVWGNGSGTVDFAGRWFAGPGPGSSPRTLERVLSNGGQTLQSLFVSFGPRSPRVCSSEPIARRDYELSNKGSPEKREMAYLYDWPVRKLGFKSRSWICECHPARLLRDKPSTDF